MSSRLDIVIDALVAFSIVDVRKHIEDFDDDEEINIVVFDHDNVSCDDKYFIEFADILLSQHSIETNVKLTSAIDDDRKHAYDDFSDRFKTFVLEKLESVNDAFKKTYDSDIFMTLADIVSERECEDTIEYDIIDDKFVQQFIE
jgi:hypothetical protein